MARTGTVVAYATPANIKKVRDMAAVITSIASEGLAQSGTPDARVHAVTAQVADNNVVCTQINRDFLLVLVGRVTPHSNLDFKSVVEREGDQRYPAAAGNEDGDLQEATTYVCNLQRVKADALCDHIRTQVGSLTDADSSPSPFVA